MAVDMTEVKRNADWYYANLDSLLPKYTGKYIGISDCSLLREAVSLSIGGDCLRKNGYQKAK